MSQLPVLPLTAAGVAAVAFLTAPAVAAIAAQLRSRTPKDNFYEDSDGHSTPESVAAFSNLRQKSAILVFSAIGLGTSVATSVLATLQPGHHEPLLVNWLLTALWALILVHGISLAVHHSPVKVYDLGQCLLGSCTIATAIAAIRITSVTPEIAGFKEPINILRLTNVAAAILLGVFSVSLPRRPEVFYNGRQVDAERTVSVLSRYTWAWVGTLLSKAAKKKDLDDADAPCPDRGHRSQALQQDWDSFNFQAGLLPSLLWAYKYNLGYQYVIAVVRCFMSMLPFWAMLRIIRILEERKLRDFSSWELWALVFCMAMFNLADAWAEGWLYWHALSAIALPMRAQLSTLIFEKSMRRKNVKAADKNAVPDDNQKDDDSDETPSQESSVLKSRQAVVNLIGVDTKRISDFAMYQILIVNSFLKLGIFSIFVTQIIGWIPFVAGFAAWGLTLPFNFYFSRQLMVKADHIMKLRDEKLAVINEALTGMRQIKFSALESRWEKRINAMRDGELKTLWQYFLADSALFACWIISPIVLAATSLAVYALVNGQLSPSVAFVSIGVFKSLELTLGALPELITEGVDAFVSTKRIGAYLSGPEIENQLSAGSEIAFENASIAWPVDEETPDEDRFILRDMNLTFPSGELSVISGKTGTGKSLLLSAIINEADLLEGVIRVPKTVLPAERNDSEANPGNWILPGSIAYVSQTPWLESASLRDNILFGLPFIEERYKKVIDACALTKDLEILTDGDKTELGANGINLSGGQKWRLSLARAVYSRADLLIMDDIFSAVDAHVGRHIYEKCLTGSSCKGRTRILVTHHVALVQSKAKYIVELGDGLVQVAGLVSDFIKDGTLQEIRQHEQTEQEALEDESAEASTAVNSEEVSVSEATQPSSGDLQRVPSKDAKQFVQEELREKGVVKKHVYWTYFQASGGLKLWAICMSIFLSYEFGELARAWWLRIWTAPSEESITSMALNKEHAYVFAFGFDTKPKMEIVQSQDNLHYYLWWYIGISAVTALIGSARFYWAYFLALKATRILFRRMLFTVLRAPMRWLDTVPVGRVLNRFTSDFSIIDQRVTIDWALFVYNFLATTATCVAALTASIYVIPLALFLLFFGGLLATRYLHGARPLKRLESNAKSPVFELFNAALTGMTTLRGYAKTQVYIDRMYNLLDYWTMVSFYMWLVNRWMSFRLTLVSTVFTGVIGAVLILNPGIDAALAGFVLSFALDLAHSVLWTIRHYAGMELNMNSTERVVEYIEIETESLSGEKPPAAWPTSGTMEVDNLEVSYAPDLPPVLKGISFKVNNNERIGVIGRTGAGKSSLTLALFRFLEARSGSVTIDGLDISKINLHSLRSRMAIIPQDPVLFSGTIRSNLDPFSDSTDEELRESLQRVHLVASEPSTPANGTSSSAASTVVPKNTNIFHDLSSPIAESGGNLSQGQRQLLCLARAIVARPKIMVLDEATSAVDMATDALIQRSIREEFTDSTLIVIAHRLSTIADFDRILVLSEGRVAEFGTPRELWTRDGSVFRDMCENSGERDKLKETLLAGN